MAIVGALGTLLSAWIAYRLKRLEMAQAAFRQRQDARRQQRRATDEAQ